MVRVIQIVHCLIFFVSFGFTSGEVEYMSYPTNFINATLICNQNGGHLASVEDLTSRYLNSTESVWTPYIFVRTPFIASKGCYKDLRSNSSFDVGKGNSSIAKCFVYCYPSKSFALNGNFCTCVPSDMKCSEDEAVNASLCDVNNVNNIYKRVYEVLSDPVNVHGDDEEGDVYRFYKCRYTGALIWISPTSRGESMAKEAATTANFYFICKSRNNVEVVSENTACKSWQDAEAACIRKNGKSMPFSLHIDHCQQLSKYVNNQYLKVSFWCDERTYSAVIYYHDLEDANIPWRNMKCTVAESPDSLKYVPCDEEGYKFVCKIEKDNASHKQNARDGAGPELKTIIVVVLVCLFACGIIVCVCIFHIKKMKNHRIEREDKNTRLPVQRVFINCFTHQVRLPLNFVRGDNDDVEPSAKSKSDVDLECGNANLGKPELQNHMKDIEEKHLETKGKDTEHFHLNFTEEIEPFLPESKSTMKGAENGENSKLISRKSIDDRKTEERNCTLEVALVEQDNADGAERCFYEVKLNCPSLNDTTNNSIDKSTNKVDMYKEEQNGIRSNIYLPRQVIDVTLTYL